MKIEDKNNIREIIADEGKLLKKADAYFKRVIMFDNETESDYQEVDESEGIEVVNTSNDLMPSCFDSSKTWA